MFASLADLKNAHERTGGWNGTSPGFFFDGHTGEAESLELIRGRWILVHHLDRDEQADTRRVLYSADECGRITFVSWLGFGVDVNSVIDEQEAAEREPEPTPISVCTPHPYMDAPEVVRTALGLPAGEAQCRYPIIGGGTCLAPADAPFHH